MKKKEVSKIHYRDLSGIGGIKWLTVTGVPHIKSEKNGYLLHSTVLKRCERLIAEFIVQHPVPIKGAEVRFLRKFLGLSLRDVGDAIGVSHVAILKWEKAIDEKLLPVNEIAVRLFFAERLNVKTDASFSKLLGTDKSPYGTHIPLGKVPQEMARA